MTDKIEKMTDDDFKKITQQLGMPESMSLYAALKQVENHTWQAARTVPDEAVSILADVIRELENGFVRCETCGDQEDTATLDCIDELRRIHYMLSAAPEPKK